MKVCYMYMLDSRNILSCIIPLGAYLAIIKCVYLAFGQLSPARTGFL